MPRKKSPPPEEMQNVAEVPVEAGAEPEAPKEEVPTGELKLGDDDRRAQ